MVMRAWQLAGPGGPEVFTCVERPVPAAEPGKVVIEVEGFGLNRSELVSRRGLSSPDFSFPRVLGLECAGRILHPSDSDLQSGARVVALMGGMGRSYDGSYATHIVVPRSQVFRAPEVPHLAAYPETYNTAVGVCLDNLQLVGTEKLLVRGGTSALGMAAIAIAKDLGCTVVATSRRPEKARRLAETSPVDQVFVDGDDIAERVLADTGSLDAVVDCVGSKAAVESSCRTMPRGGRLGMVGQLAESWGTDAPPHIPEGITHSFTRSDLIRSPDDDERVRKFLDKAAAGRYPPNVHAFFSFEDLPEAHRVMEANEAVGKLVVEVGC